MEVEDTTAAAGTTAVEDTTAAAGTTAVEDTTEAEDTAPQQVLDMVEDATRQHEVPGVKLRDAYLHLKPQCPPRRAGTGAHLAHEMERAGLREAKKPNENSSDKIPAHRRANRTEAAPVTWLIIEKHWPKAALTNHPTCSGRRQPMPKLRTNGSGSLRDRR
jgi:hypothetical protein